MKAHNDKIFIGGVPYNKKAEYNKQPIEIISVLPGEKLEIEFKYIARKKIIEIDDAELKLTESAS